jgi:hypothetical protein
MLKKHTTINVWFTLAAIALFVLFPLILAGTQTAAAEAGKGQEKTAKAGWTKCTATTCIDTVIIGRDSGGKKTLSFTETTYIKHGKVISRRGGFATKNVNFKQAGLTSAWIDGHVKVDRCDAQDACKKTETVHVKASWAGTGNTWEDPDAGVRLRDAKVRCYVDGKKLGNLNFANLTEGMR